jgi:hypothetical protein
MNTQRKREPVMLTVAELAAVADKIRPERPRALVLRTAALYGPRDDRV